MTDSLSMDATSSQVSHLIREKEEKRARERRRDLLYIIVDFLEKQGYSTDTLIKEARLSKEIEVCDNIDLDTILLEYTNSYFVKFQKYPKLCKVCKSPASKQLANGSDGKKIAVARKDDKVDAKKNKKNSIEKEKVSQNDDNSEIGLDFEFIVKPIGTLESVEQDNRHSIESTSKRLMKPISGLYPADQEKREIAESICTEIVTKNLNVRWDDIKGYKEQRNFVKEATMFPLKYPNFFTGKFSPWKGILLYGPPGTGKTMLAKAVATECQYTFFNITSSSLVSKWRGDSEKYVRVLFDVAYYYAPTVIFIDEIDWISTKNNGESSEPARRFRSELLARLDGLLSPQDSTVILLAATNVPWDIDDALLRRLEKKIYIPLPSSTTRKKILGFYFSKNLHNTKEFDQLVANTASYSCADLKLICKEAWFHQLQSQVHQLQDKEVCENDVKSAYLNDFTSITWAMNRTTINRPNSTNRYTDWLKESKGCSSNVK